MVTESSPKTKNENQSSQLGLWVAFFIGLVLLGVSAATAHANNLNGLQARVFYDINNIRNGYTTPAKWVTEGLGAAYPVIICVLVPLLFKKYRLAWRFFFTAGGALAVSLVIKYLIDEPRPIIMLHHHLQQRVVETGPGFPSNHVAVATALALTLWFILPAAWRWVAALWIIVVAWSRIYLGVHTPADVVAGFAIGLMAVCFVRLLPPKIAERLKLN